MKETRTDEKLRFLLLFPVLLIFCFFFNLTHSNFKNFIQTVILHYKRLASALAREQLDRATEVSLLVEKFRDLKAKLSKVCSRKAKEVIENYEV